MFGMNIKRLLTSAYSSSFLTMMVERTPSAAVIIAKTFADSKRRSNVAMTDRVVRNLSAALPGVSQDEVRRLAKEHWRSKFYSGLERVYLRQIPSEPLIRHCRTTVSIEGAEHLQAARDSSRPAVFFSPHYGDFILGGLRLILELESSKCVSIFYESPENNDSTGDIKGLIDKLGCNTNVLLNNESAVLKGLRALKKGGALVMFPDIFELNSGTIVVPFLGKLAVAMGGTAFFAWKSDALLFPFYCYRRDASHFVLRFEAPFEPSRTGDLKQDISLTTAKIFKNMEQQVLRSPEHWVYWHLVDQWFRLALDVDLPDATVESWCDGFDAVCERLKLQQPSLESALNSILSVVRENQSFVGRDRAA